MPRTLIIHGLDGSPAPHWQHWWALSDPRAISVDLPDAHAPNACRWEDELAGAILRHPDSILVGHSLGAVLVARLLTKYPQLKVRAAMLVAPASPDADKRLKTFAPLPQAKFNVPSMVVASRNDPWMSFSQAKAQAQAWGSKLIDLGYAGHINVASGFGPWPEGKTLRDSLLAGTQRHSLPVFSRPVASYSSVMGAAF